MADLKHALERRCRSLRQRVSRWCVLLFCAGASGLWAQEKKALTVGIFYQGTDGYYVREETDREWHLRFQGPIQPACGMYLVVHDAQGRFLAHQAIPEGRHTAASPYVVTIPADGKTGDYKIVLLGTQMDFFSLPLPLTDLPLEVYGGRCFIFDDNLLKPCFEVPTGVTNVVLSPQRNARVLRADGAVVAELEKQKRLDAKGRPVMDVAVAAGTPYLLEPASRYFKCDPPLFLACSPERWFAPDPALDKVKWWDNLIH